MTGRNSFTVRVKIASPCPASWDAMVGDERVRFCSSCQKNVYNLSALSTAAALTLIEEMGGRLCGRFYQRSDGTLLTADCPVGVRRAERRVKSLIAVTVAACVAAVFCGWASLERPASKKEVLAQLRQIKPLEPIIEWLDPTPPAPPIPPRGRILMGSL